MPDTENRILNFKLKMQIRKTKGNRSTGCFGFRGTVLSKCIRYIFCQVSSNSWSKWIKFPPFFVCFRRGGERQTDKCRHTKQKPLLIVLQPQKRLDTKGVGLALWEEEGR
jgi:hypothetical protein